VAGLALVFAGQQSLGNSLSPFPGQHHLACTCPSMPTHNRPEAASPLPSEGLTNNSSHCICLLQSHAAMSMRSSQMARTATSGTPCAKQQCINAPMHCLTCCQNHRCTCWLASHLALTPVPTAGGLCRYGGLLLLAFGLSAATGSDLRFAASFALFYVLDRKARVSACIASCSATVCHLIVSVRWTH
jgi:hypothetical protein